jgi:predicted nuclease with TOPRIM domain
MERILEFKEFQHSKSMDELLYENSQFTANLNFINTELEFLKHLIKTYSFRNKILNLYERIQLFSIQIDKLNDEKNELLNKIKHHETELNGMLECEELSCDNFYMMEHQKLAALIFNFIQKYQEFKTEIYQYITGIIE